MPTTTHSMDFDESWQTITGYGTSRNVTDGNTAGTLTAEIDLDNKYGVWFSGDITYGAAYDSPVIWHVLPITGLTDTPVDRLNSMKRVPVSGSVSGTHYFYFWVAPEAERIVLDLENESGADVVVQLRWMRGSPKSDTP